MSVGCVFELQVFPVAQTAEFACSTGDLCLIPELGKSSEEGNGNPLQNSCLENPTDRGDWWVTKGLQRARHG